MECIKPITHSRIPSTENVIAKASCAEVLSQLYVALDVGYIGKTTFKKLSDNANEVARIVSALRNSVDKQRK